MGMDIPCTIDALDRTQSSVLSHHFPDLEDPVYSRIDVRKPRDVLTTPVFQGIVQDLLKRYLGSEDHVLRQSKWGRRKSGGSSKPDYAHSLAGNDRSSFKLG
ncbi:hypothetical protein K435DRAFT_875909 [Dendrothele bispora CBS 962.96]|uniref:Uncharacterized protein n=1 Tax=Dendrothele bispora (strain CBS 962.96) TaxID=1314807 RepID=A0A4V4HBE5_DENBC|nr:hypothetical protein K435DRAFT_875909 [Dendrothele bispora CBS 962.96]